MQGQCCICTELFELNSDISATQCGHTFHPVCLQQWLEQSKTCPHCRNKVNPKYVVEKLYFDTTTEAGPEHVDVSSIQNQLSDVKAQLKLKAKERRDLQEECDAHKKKMDELREGFSSMKMLYKQEKSNINILKRELQMQKELQQEAEIAKEQAKMLRQKLANLQNVEKIVNGHADEIESIISRGDIKQLSTWCCILQKELHEKRQECRTLRDSSDKQKRESSSLKRAVNEKSDALHVALEQVKLLQEEIKDADREVMKLKKKNDALLKAIGSPSDTVRSLAHRLIHESPAPTFTPPPHKKPRLSDQNQSLIELDDMDTSADMFSSPRKFDINDAGDPSPSTQRKRRECTEYGTKFVKITSAAAKNASSSTSHKPEMTDISNIPGMSNFNLFKKKTGMGLADSSSVIRKGYNGLGGHEKFINVKPKNDFKAPAPVKKQKFKFGPSKTLSNKCPPLPTMNNFITLD